MIVSLSPHFYRKIMDYRLRTEFLKQECGELTEDSEVNDSLTTSLVGGDKISQKILTIGSCLGKFFQPDKSAVVKRTLERHCLVYTPLLWIL
ncbi:hypothetical protein NPIL_657031 [Nephila pilipes]|uniref:Uncharacterized protein n=1 Tax=Nephila pilipes TaxID=299642 RepID=A0A8X6MZ21_NEPPI|nr:hypothetical protein NPIL_657031 [Nephila pilipes]